MDTIENRARELHVSMYEVIRNEDLFSGKTQRTISEFVNMVEHWRKEAEQGETEIFRLFEKVIEESGLRRSYEESKELERVENLKELIDDAKEFSEDYPESTLEEYLQLVSLYGDREETLASDFVQLMTVHAAKGLEFDTVFVLDCIEEVFPRANGRMDELEEELRCFYVAITRPKKHLFICCPRMVMQNGRSVYGLPSRWIEDYAFKKPSRRGYDYGFNYEDENQDNGVWVEEIF
jgi:DNA helicase-2/ATP-dependent DNA helicase PcrA